MEDVMTVVDQTDQSTSKNIPKMTAITTTVDVGAGVVEKRERSVAGDNPDHQHPEYRSGMNTTMTTGGTSVIGVLDATRIVAADHRDLQPDNHRGHRRVLT
jgi:hypothetical protein